jgi:hypothetical protein
MPGDFLMQGRQDVAVRVHGESDAAMRAYDLHHVGMYALTQEVGGCRMPQIVRPDAREFGLLERDLWRR